MQKALITGITGQDGSYLTELLLLKGYEVHGLIRRASTFNTERIDHIYQDPHESGTRLFLHYGDLANMEQLSNLIYNEDKREFLRRFNAILYQNAGLFVSPSLFEGFGMPPVEAMYNKIPVITTRKASLPEVTMGKAFYYEPAKDFKALSQKMLEVIENYPSDEELDRLAKEIYQRYNLRKITQEYVDFFERVVNQ